MTIAMCDVSMKMVAACGKRVFMRLGLSERTAIEAGMAYASASLSSSRTNGNFPVWTYTLPPSEV